ncbi:MAG: translation initiation factor IF-2 [Flavobacteriales bacterium]
MANKSDDKPVRLSKVAKEFNIGLSTIADFLANKGYDINPNPNAKIDRDLLDILKSEFQSEKSVKEESKEATTQKEKKETVSLDDQEEQGSDKKEAEQQDEVMITNTTDAENQVSSPSVVGKINLDKFDKKKQKQDSKKEEDTEKPSETEKETPSQAKEEKTEEEEKSEESEENQKEQEGSQESEKPSENKEDTENKGPSPTVVGKIDLPEKEMTGASPQENKEKKKKRKRKRIKKVDVDSVADKKKSQTQKKKKKKKKNKGPDISEDDIQKEVKDTLAKLSENKKSKAAKLRRAKREEISNRMEEEQKREEEEKNKLKLTEFVTVSEMANMMDVDPNEVISALMTLGIFASINQRLNAETLSLVAEEFGYEVEFISAEVQEAIPEDKDDPKNMQPRAPIVTVMGHVDHGKTSLLDHIRNENVIAGESGGITQHIGAYNVKTNNDKRITFLDTPGHEAFTAMRSRGAQVTDVAIIIIAADDQIKPQTKEAINHAQAAEVPMVFAINKIDKPDSDPDKVKEQLSQMDILVEDWGGKYQCQEISAKKGNNVDELLEKVLLEAELLELKADPDKRSTGAVIESTLDKGRGYVTTLLVQAGTLKIGDVVLAGCYSGRVKALFNERGQKIKQTGPSMPASMLGLNGPPNAGDKFNVLQNEKEAREIANKRYQLQREQGVRAQKHVTLDEIGRRLAIGDFKELNIIVKGDVDGSIEALSDSLLKLSTEQIQVNIIHKGVGQISESDVLLASASDAIIIGFQVRPSANARKVAQKEEVEIRLYSVVYNAVEEVKSAMEGMLSPKVQEEVTGTAEIKETFKISKVGTIAGCYISDGKIHRNNKVRLIRDGVVIHTGTLGSLKRFKDDVKEVQSGYECGLNLEKFNDIKPGDQIEAFKEVEVKQTLEETAKK